MSRTPTPGDRVRISINPHHTLQGQMGTVLHIDDSDILPYLVDIDDAGEGSRPTWFDASELTILDPVTNPTYTEDAGQ